MGKQYLTRKYEMDIAHRVMNERVKCGNNHGHRISLDITLSFEESASIGYQLDFKEVKRVLCSYLDEYFDHGSLYNAHDTILINACNQINACGKIGSKLHLMCLNGEGNFCNPTAENISKEIFYISSILLDNKSMGSLKTHCIRLYETPSCYIDTYRDSISNIEWNNLDNSYLKKQLEDWKKEMGVFEYDETKENFCDFDINKITN